MKTVAPTIADLDRLQTMLNTAEKKLLITFEAYLKSWGWLQAYRTHLEMLAVKAKIQDILSNGEFQGALLKNTPQENFSLPVKKAQDLINSYPLKPIQQNPLRYDPIEYDSQAFAGSTFRKPLSPAELAALAEKLPRLKQFLIEEAQPAAPVGPKAIPTDPATEPEEK